MKRRATRNHEPGLGLLAASLAALTLLLTGGTAAAFSDDAFGSCGDEPGFAGGRGHGGEHPRIERMLERHADRLDLDDETRAQIRSIAQATRQQTEPMRAGLDGLRSELRAMLDQDTPDEAAVMLKADEMGALKTELRKQQLRSMLEVRALLTPEQRAELVEIHQERRMRRDRFGKRGRFGDRDRGGLEEEPEL